MLFRNDTPNNIKYRTGSLNTGYSWFTLRTEEIIDLPEATGNSLSLTKVEDDKQEANENQADVEQGLRAKTPEKDPEKYRKELLSIKGVGKKSVEEILENYPTEEALRKAIQDKEVIHQSIKIDNAIINHYNQ